MEKIKVYLQYPWKFPDSPYYKYLTNLPPKGINFLNAKKQKGVITSKRFFLFSNFLKKQIRFWTNKLGISVPNAHLSPNGNYNLIHCCHCLSKNTDKPWVADIEASWQMYVGKEARVCKKIIEKALMGSNCKKIMPWTNHCKNKLLEDYPELGGKMEVVYPAIPEKKIKRTRKNKKGITLIFSGRYFYAKGGLHSLEVIDRLTKKYENVYGIFNSEVPNNIFKKYSKNKKIEFYGLIPQKELFNLYERSDILIYPGYTDSFGFAYLESMSFGIPIITANGTARKEIIKDGETGFVIERSQKMKKDKLDDETILGFMNKASILIEDNALREKMSDNCIEEIKNGKFSIKTRDRKLKRIYAEAIK